MKTKTKKCAMKKSLWNNCNCNSKLQRKQQIVSNFRLFLFKCIVCSFISSNFLNLFLFVLYLFILFGDIVFFFVFNVILSTDFLISQNVFLCFTTFIAIVHYFIFFCQVLSVCFDGWLSPMWMGVGVYVCNFWC